MSKKIKLTIQILSLCIITCCFLFFNTSIYLVFTSKCQSNFGDINHQPKIIEVDQYLPFDENSKIVKINSEIKIEGDLPILDGATALLPIYSSIAHAIYPKDSVIFDGEKYTDESSIRFTDTKYAYLGVIDGDVDIVICAAPSKSLQDYANEKKVSNILC